MARYCPTCNRSSDECQFVGEFCEHCIAGKLRRTMPKMIRTYQCRFCNRVKVGQTFMDPGNEKRVLGKAIAHELGSEFEVGVLNYGHRGVATCRVTKKFDGVPVSFEIDITIKELHETCQKCYRISAGYYQGIVQLRGNRDKMARLMAKLSRYLERRGGYITKVEDAPNGIDIYVSHKEAANGFFIAHDLKPVKSYRLWGVKRGKKVNRNTYSLHVD